MPLLDDFKAIYEDPLEQGVIGHIPAEYILAAFARHPNDAPLRAVAAALVAPHPPPEPFEQQTRSAVGNICRNVDVDTLVAYCYAMAWGMQWKARGGYDNFLRSIADLTELRNNLRKLRTNELGAEHEPPQRQKAFRLFKTSNPIPRLGPSYFTKLIFFFLPKDGGGYILDSRTEDSFRGLYPELNNAPLPPNLATPDRYERYCVFVEQLAHEMEWTPCQAEQALFGAKHGPGLQWRNRIRLYLQELEQ